MGLKQQELAFRQGLEKELTTKDDCIHTLEQELEVAKKLTEENKTAHKTAEEQIAKVHEDFADYRRRKTDERKRLWRTPRRWQMYI